MKKSIFFVLAVLTILSPAFAKKKAVPKTDAALKQLLIAAGNSFRGVTAEPVEYMAHCYRSTIALPGTEDAYIELSDTVHPYYTAYIIRGTTKEKALVTLKHWKQKIAATFPKLKCKKTSKRERYTFMDANVEKLLPGIFISANEDSNHPAEWNVAVFINHDM